MCYLLVSVELTYPALNSPNTDLTSNREGNPDKVKRPTFYMTNRLFQAIEYQAQQERTSRSRLVTSLLSFLLLSPIGQQLQENARPNNRTLAQELEQTLVLLKQQLPHEQISKLASASQRSPANMIVYLALLGLQVYLEGEELNQIEDSS